ncbi:S1C family serine protease [Gilvimarinus sp. F26214L]|uniref:S1C family serine protease n=1 Tax=Gilvimarinus sp. DZF01 TaxID=3461371 RepID=UPI0040465753
MALKRFLNFAGWPAATGMLAALLVLLLAPQLGKQQPDLNGGQDAGFGFAHLSPSQDWSGPVSYAAAVRRAAPAVVNIYTSRRSRSRHPFFDDPVIRELFNFADRPQQQQMMTILGSGVIVSEQGYILTNNHVIEGADEIIVQLHDGRESKATPVGAHADSDLAVLKIELDELTAINIGMPDQAQVGDVVLAIGNPFGVGQSVSQGIISATSRLSKTQKGLQSFIQTDAAINPGNSGGALVDVYGNLLGINTAIVGGNYSGDSVGIGFAIPASIAMAALEEIIEYSRTVRGYLGVAVGVLTPQLAKSLNLSFTAGFLIYEIDVNSPAHRAGLLPGDVITRVNDQVFEDGTLIASELSGAKPGESVEIEVWRQGAPQVIHVTVGLASAVS